MTVCSLVLFAALFTSVAFATIGIGHAENSNNNEYFAYITDRKEAFCKTNCSTITECSEMFPDEFVDLRLKVDFTDERKPSQSLITGIFLGKTIGLQTFKTQFILDLSYALDISPCRAYVTSVDLGINHREQNADTVMITFRLFIPVVSFQTVKELTRQIQYPHSKFYQGNVTKMADPLFGLEALRNDFSLKLVFAIDVIGGPAVRYHRDGNFLNQGSSRWCEESANNKTVYCDFEFMFRSDLAKALAIESNYIDVKFVKAFGLGNVLIYFRFLSTNFAWIDHQISMLNEQVANEDSELYHGNVTVRIDKTWGVSGDSGTPRNLSRYLAYTTRDQSSIDSYERCKHARRCPRGWVLYNQSNSESSYVGQQFAGGLHESIPYFGDFEDWRKGTNGWGYKLANTKKNRTKKQSIKGSHWSPFDFISLGPTVPSFNTSSNNGLVLNRKSLLEQLAKQEKKIQEIMLHMQWIEDNAEIAILDVKSRSRRDVRKVMMTIYADNKKLLDVENEKYSNLAASQCKQTLCSILFNTSNLQLTGDVNATGVLATSPDGTEVAVWSFDSIDVGPEVNISVTGQRAMTLLSRSSCRINTTIKADPGSLGGFPGGFSVARKSTNVDADKCNELSKPCPGDVPLSSLDNETVSNNVNGPGSPSVRVYIFNIKSDAQVRNEVQSITSDAQKGQKLSGGFIVHFGVYSSTLIPHDATERQMKTALEDSLNAAKMNILGNINRTNIVPGIGRVDVSRQSFGASGGYKWNITFVTAVGNVGPLRVTNKLIGASASLIVNTMVQGNKIGGNFVLKFLGFETRPLPHNASSTEMQLALIRDIPSLLTAQVDRSDPTNNCNDGFCDNGPSRSGGYSWALTLTTTAGNISPSSPTSREFDMEGEKENLITVSHLTGCVKSVCPALDVHTTGAFSRTSACIVNRPFSLAFGGAGAGYGGEGGKGVGHQLGRPYGDSRISNLYGGSGGSIGYLHPCDALVSEKSYIRGGDGGGAIEIVAFNDIVIGSNALITCDGGKGSNGYMFAGGGGSGGSIVLAAGGSINLEGKLSARGGDGGKITSKSLYSGSGGGGRIAIHSQTINLALASNLDLNGGRCFYANDDDGHTSLKNVCEGKAGTLYLDEALQHNFFIDYFRGAMGTGQSLFLRSSRANKHPIREGPVLDLGKIFQPERVSFYLMLDGNLVDGNAPDLWGASVQLHESFSSDYAMENEAVLIGMAIGRSHIKHLANYDTVSENTDFLDFMEIFYNAPPKMKEWHKFDLRLNWTASTYDLHLNDNPAVDGAKFSGAGIRVISLNVLAEGVHLWIDEIYVGRDFTMGFKCPQVTDVGVKMDRPIEHGWSKSDIGPTSTIHDMQRHESFLSRRPLYNRPDKGGLAPFDGSGHQNYFLDVKFRYEGGDLVSHGSVNEGAILRISQTSNSSKGITRYFWYGEHEGIDSANLEGGAVSCSTEDFEIWRNEGTLFSYENVSDFVNGFGGNYSIQRPKVLYNKKTEQYVMWMTITNETDKFGMAGVATSRFPGGPFDFVRSFYPDGNETRDQAVFQKADGSAYLIRTYYATVDYVLPSPVMQPMWESVQNSDGSINFGLSYHRAYYEPGYDNVSDISEQRLRGEDKKWKVTCINRITGAERDVPYGTKYFNKDGATCDDPTEYKKVIGQAIPIGSGSDYNIIKSRYLDPRDPANNFWLPNSVPGVQAQPWSANNMDGNCHISWMVDGDNAADCSNIADNPPHRTPPDQLIGPQMVVEKRRTKYVAISQLTDDYLDTTGVLHSVEGELVTSNTNQVEADYLLSLVGVAAEDETPLGFDWEGLFTTNIHCSTARTSLRWRIGICSFINMKSNTMIRHDC